MKMIKKSAEVLNDADRQQRIMDWVLFRTEQDSRLWGDYTGWRPGDPIWDYPDYACGEQYVRHIFDIMEEGLFNSMHEVYFRARCNECQVWWAGDDPCFVCGADIPIKDYSFEFIPTINRPQTFAEFEMELLTRHRDMSQERIRRYFLENNEAHQWVERETARLMGETMAEFQRRVIGLHVNESLQ